MATARQWHARPNGYPGDVRNAAQTNSLIDSTQVCGFGSDTGRRRRKHCATIVLEDDDCQSPHRQADCSALSEAWRTPAPVERLPQRLLHNAVAAFGIPQLFKGLFDPHGTRRGAVPYLTGGKFGNGAITAACSRAFNDELSRTGGGRASGQGSGGGTSLKVGQSRPMTGGEVAMAKEIFGDDIDYAKVSVFNRKFAIFQRKGVAMSPNGNICFQPADYLDDFSLAGMSGRSWFIHEVTHVWQHQ